MSRGRRVAGDTPPARHGPANLAQLCPTVRRGCSMIARAPMPELTKITPHFCSPLKSRSCSFLPEPNGGTASPCPCLQHLAPCLAAST